MDEKQLHSDTQFWEMPQTGFLRLDRARVELIRQMEDLSMTANGLSSMAHMLRYADFSTLEGVTEALDKARRAGPL